jgi:hypothetical protein
MQKPPKLEQTQRALIAALLCLAFGIAVFDSQSRQSPPTANNTSSPERTSEQNDSRKKVSEGVTADDWLALFTLGLVIVGGIQLRLFYVQLRLIRESLGDAKKAADAAKEAADAAKISADHIPRVERAYLFLDLTIDYEFLEGDNTQDTRSTINFKFRNHGRTPAIIKELHGMAGYRSTSGWPSMMEAGKQTVQIGAIVSGRDTIQEGYAIRFNLTKWQREQAARKSGRVLFWGKIVYDNVFGQECETGWCREFFEENGIQSAGFYVAGDETLNYYT